MAEPKAWEPSPWRAGYERGMKRGRQVCKRRLAEVAVQLLNRDWSRDDVRKALRVSPGTLKRWLSTNKDACMRIRAKIGPVNPVTGRRAGVLVDMWTQVFEQKKLTDKQWAQELKNNAFKQSSKARYARMAELYMMRNYSIAKVAKTFSCCEKTVYNAISWFLKRELSAGEYRSWKKEMESEVSEIEYHAMIAKMTPEQKDAYYARLDKQKEERWQRLSGEVVKSATQPLDTGKPTGV